MKEVCSWCTKKNVTVHGIIEISIVSVCLPTSICVNINLSTLVIITNWLFQDTAYFHRLSHFSLYVVSEDLSTFMDVYIGIKCILSRIIFEQEFFKALRFATLCINSCNSLLTEDSSMWTETFGTFILYLNLSIH